MFQALPIKILPLIHYLALLLFARRLISSRVIVYPTHVVRTDAQSLKHMSETAKYEPLSTKDNMEMEENKEKPKKEALEEVELLPADVDR